MRRGPKKEICVRGVTDATGVTGVVIAFIIFEIKHYVLQSFRTNNKDWDFHLKFQGPHKKGRVQNKSSRTGRWQIKTSYFITMYIAHYSGFRQEKISPPWTRLPNHDVLTGLPIQLRHIWTWAAYSHGILSGLPGHGVDWVGCWVTVCIGLPVQMWSGLHAITMRNGQHSHCEELAAMWGVGCGVEGVRSHHAEWAAKTRCKVGC